jgi:general secretion pathway protein I
MKRLSQKLASNKSTGAHGDAGFSLLEVIVATAIVAIAFVALMEIFSSGLRTEGMADEYTLAMQHATRVMNDVLVTSRQAQSAQFDGRFDDGATWHASVEPFVSPGEVIDPARPMRMQRMLLRVEVTWSSRGSPKKVQLQTIKNVISQSSKS